MKKNHNPSNKVLTIRVIAGVITFFLIFEIIFLFSGFNTDIHIPITLLLLFIVLSMFIIANSIDNDEYLNRVLTEHENQIHEFRQRINKLEGKNNE